MSFRFCILAILSLLTPEDIRSSSSCFTEGYL